MLFPAVGRSKCKDPQADIAEGERPWTVLNGLPLLIPSLRAQRSLQKSRQKMCKRQMGWRIPGEQGPVNKLFKAHRSTHRLK